MTAIDIIFAPHIALSILVILAILAGALVGISLLLRAPGTLLRAVAMAAAVLVLCNPVMIQEQQKPLPDVVVVVADESQSQSLGDRAKSVATTLEQMKKKLSAVPDLETRVVTITGNRAANTDGGTSLFAPIAEALSDLPPDRIAGAILITDGQVHDVPAGAAAKLNFPVHALLTGARNEGDRKLSIEQAPRFGIVNEILKFVVRVDDFGSDPGLAELEVRIDGKVVHTQSVTTGKNTEIPLRLPHGGENVVEMSASAGPKELTLLNNRAAVAATGVRDQLRVLLVSGEPHAGERTLRNLLKADPSVSLVHFTILRPPEKQDGTPVDELSLIAFPTRELFDEKLNEFNLIIFDRYQKRGVVLMSYYDNIARYVENGGALLVTSGPEFSSPLSLYRSPLASILPAEPTERVIEQGYKPHLTNQGERHPVTSGLPGANSGTTAPTWGRWFRLVQASVLDGQTLMSGPESQPLLILNKVQQGRVALLLSDHAWLWTRGLEGGGPQAELLRRLAHWLMKEPDLEEERLHGTVQGDRLIITRRTMSDRASMVEVTHPSGRIDQVTLSPAKDGAFSGTVKADEIGLYRLKDGALTAVAAAGPLNAKELADVRSTDELLKPVITATRGSARWIGDGLPNIQRVGPGRPASGESWIGLQKNDAFSVTSTKQTPLFHPALALFLILGGLLFGWHREGR